MFNKIKKAIELGKKAKKGYDMLRVKGKSTPAGKSKVKMMKTVNKSKKEMDDVIKEGEKVIKKSKTSTIKYSGQPANKHPMAVDVAKRLRDAKRYRRKLDKIDKDTRKLKTPLKTYSERVEKAEGGKVLKSVDKEKNPGLAKLPKGVRNKMGYMKKGGRVKKYV